jgi:hypothetical protein
MTTVLLRGKEYQLGNFSEFQMLPLAKFFGRIKGDSLLNDEQKIELLTLIKKSSFPELADTVISQLTDTTVPVTLWQELAEVLSDIIIPDIPLELVNPKIRRGIFLNSDEFLKVYLACIDKLKQDGSLSDKDIEEIENESEIERLKAELDALKNK